MLTDGEYQKKWVSIEKHGAKELLIFQGHSNTWGIHFQPLGDYVDGKIVPFPIIERATNSIVADIQKLEAWRETAQYLGIGLWPKLKPKRDESHYPFCLCFYPFFPSFLSKVQKEKMIHIKPKNVTAGCARRNIFGFDYFL